MDTTNINAIINNGEKVSIYEAESLQLSYNDETIDIIYHFTGQW